MVNKLTIKKMTTLPDFGAIENLKKFYEENPPDIGGSAPKTIERIEVNILDLITNNLPAYQRKFEWGRVKTIIKSIRQFGLLEIILISLVMHNKNLEIHDGRHRTIALYILGYKTIPAMLIVFKNKKDEIKHFNTINRAIAGAKLDQRIFNDYQADEPLGLLLYDLGFMDKNSKWSNKVALIGTKNAKEKMNVSNFLKIVNWAGLGLKRSSQGSHKHRANLRIQKLEYEEIKRRTNEFHDWFYNFATEVKVVKDIFHTSKVLTSLLEFYLASQKQQSTLKMLQPETILNSAVNKFRRVNWLDLSKFSSVKAPDMLFEAFNKKREKYPVLRV